MNNQELEKKIKEIIAIPNYFDMVLAAKEFEKEYKQSDFYKATKQSVWEVIKNCKVFYFIQLDDLVKLLQTKIDNLSFDNINQVLNQFSEVFGQENKEILDAANLLKSIMQ